MTEQISIDRLTTIRRITWIGLWVNAALMLIKILCGSYGHSDALVADGVHSLSDFATDMIVLIFVGIAYRSADAEHPYGHGKFETFASLLIAVGLLVIGAILCLSGVASIIACLKGFRLLRPDVWTLVVATISIVSKEILFRVTYSTGKRIDSKSLIANAWHHRSDAISSIATLIGVSAAYFLGEQWRVLDPIACVAVSIMIIFAAIKIAMPAVNELLEKSLPPHLIAQAEAVISSTPNVLDWHRLRTRCNGSCYIFSLHIKVDPDYTVRRSHEIATDVENRLRDAFSDHEVLTIVHVEPYSGVIRKD